jgi:hypothetical protein
LARAAVHEEADAVIAAHRAHQEALADLAAVRRENAEMYRRHRIEDAERAERTTDTPMQ